MTYWRKLLVASGPARVGVVPALNGDELPLVKARTEVKLQHTGCADLLGLHPRFVRSLLIAARRTARPHYELADAPSRRTFATGGYAGEALVAVDAPREDDIGVMVIELSPEWLHLGAIFASTGSIERVVEVGQRALRWVLGEVSSKPAPLSGPLATPADLLAVAVEDHDVPGPSIVGVVASGPPRTPSEVIEVGFRPRGVIVVVAGGGLGPVVVLPPGGVVAVPELAPRALALHVVPQGEDRPRYPAQQPGRGAVVRLRAAGDVARAHERHCCRGLRGPRHGRERR